MPLELQITDSESDFETIIELQWRVFKHPPDPWMAILFPILGNGPSARAEAFQDSKNRQWQQTKEDSTSQWLKVVDADTGKIIAAGMWHTFETDPFDGVPDKPFVADWWPEGSEGKKYTELCLGEFTDRRKRRMKRPHMLLERCFTHPDYRKLGAGSLLVQWGIDRADELDLEAFVEATKSGVSLYEKHGFVVSDSFHIETEREGASEEWQKLVWEVPIEYTFLWRPKKGIWIPGETRFPWEGEY